MIRDHERCGFTITELLFVTMAIGILLALLMPALRVSRREGMRPVCQNNLRHFALATINYESAFQRFPACTGIGDGKVGSKGQVSGLVALLPYLDQGKMYETINEGGTFNGKSFAPFPPLDSVGFKPWEMQNSLFLCHSAPVADSDFGQVHYAFCIGDRARNITNPSTLRGGFGGSLQATVADITDGMSNTIMMAEIGPRSEMAKQNYWAINRPTEILESPAECLGLTNGRKDWNWNQAVALSPSGRGNHWADGRAGVALFNTILPPNSPSASTRVIGSDGIYSASSPHAGGVNVARCDGSVSFIDETIDAGDSSKPTLTEVKMSNYSVSPYGVWGALGVINDGEIVDEY